MRGRAALVVFACFASGCGFSVELGATNGDGGTTGDGTGSATGDGGLGCYGTGLVKVCTLTQPPVSYTVTLPTTFDTNVGGNCTVVGGSINNGPINGVCVVVADTISISSSLRATGPRPLILVATKTFEIDGTIDVSSHEGSEGAGVSTTVCQSGPGPSDLGGGAGGTFTGQGGGGGNQSGGTSGPISAPPTSVRGGCRGQEGDGPFDIGGNPGSGGGAFYAIAGMSIDVSGTINASGQGGRGGTFGTVAGGGGGGGGGSGGMIVLDAPTVVVAGQVFANGGGGGGGSSGIENAGAGDDPQSAQAMPEGGNNAAGGGKGGRGSAGALIGGGTGETRTLGGTGGGGGGGGAGYTKVYGTLVMPGQISPPPAP